MQEESPMVLMGLELNLLCESGKVIKMGIQSLNSSADTMRKNEFFILTYPLVVLKH